VRTLGELIDRRPLASSAEPPPSRAWGRSRLNINDFATGRPVTTGSVPDASHSKLVGDW
jgi:hypothetical protein